MSHGPTVRSRILNGEIQEFRCNSCMAKKPADELASKPHNNRNVCVACYSAIKKRNAEIRRGL